MSEYIEPQENWEKFKKELEKWTPGNFIEDGRLAKTEMDDGYIIASEDGKMVVNPYNKRERKLENVRRVKFTSRGQLKVMLVDFEEGKAQSTTTMRFSWHS